MKRLFLYVIIICTLWTSVKAQYITNVIEYVPAPGQYINTAPWGIPSSANSLIGGIEGTLNLGAFGGYVIFEFESPVQNNPNNPYGIDFTIFNNALHNFSEAAIVYVMNDENENGIPDDNWYELAGSDYFFKSSINDYEVTYINPGQNCTDILWEDNYNNSGIVATNSFHTQNYYPNQDSFPAIPQDNYTLSGSFIKGHIDRSNQASIKSYKRAFGYADNTPRNIAPWTIPDNPYTKSIENSGGDGFDISWAINTDGHYVDLDEIHFIKIQNAMQHNAGWLGELSTEITGACVVSPDNTILGETKLVLFETLPDTIRTENLQLNPICFQFGRKTDNLDFNWDLTGVNAIINENNELQLLESGELTVSIFLDENQQVTHSQTVFIELNNKILTNYFPNISLYPSPAQDYIQLKGTNNTDIQIYDYSGKLLLQINNYQENNQIQLSNFTSGNYLIKLSKANRSKTFPFIIKQ